MAKIFSLHIVISPIVAISIAGIFTYTGGYTVWSYILWGLAAIWLIVSVIYSLINREKSSKGREKPLKVPQAKIYQVGDGSQWLRLKVQNPNLANVKGCYGKLLDRKQVAGGLTKWDGELIRPPISSEAGRKSMEHMELPPEGHRFPWSPTDRSLTNITISGDGSYEFLYLVTKRKQTGCFWFPASAGNEPENWSIGDFELELEIGSESESSSPTKVRVVFRAEGEDLELISLDTL